MNTAKVRLSRVLWGLLVVPLLALACNLPLTPVVGVDQLAEQTLTARPPNAPLEAAPPDGLPIVTVVGTPGVNSGGHSGPTQGAVVTPFPIPSSASRLEGGTFHYVTQPGDTLAALALRFNVDPAQVPNPDGTPANQYLPAGRAVDLPNTLTMFSPGTLLLPDSEVVYSPAAADFSVADYVAGAGGFLSTYTEVIDGETLTGAQIIQRVADETSINPRLLLGFLEYRAHWVLGKPGEVHNVPYPIGFSAGGYSGLLGEMTLTARQLTLGYYGWRSGKGVDLTFLDRTHLRIEPTVNAGTAALQYLFAVLYKPSDWQTQLYTPGQFMGFYYGLMGDAWQRAAAVGPLLPPGLAQPVLELPFTTGMNWSFTGGPHAAWGVGSPWGGLDFAPAAVESGCNVSRFWATAAASGVVVRAGNGQVLLDLDGDGREQTGWDLLYLHVAARDRPEVGKPLNVNDPVGHPSCEGGFATGTHVHIARKYNGEWQAADGPLPFVLSGWQASAGDRVYAGILARDGRIVTARPDGSHTSLITR